ncbi:hypothetical protein SERLA73DRAFT_93339 [Serpula lacrymans var. lacrymans S7.3]|uniref:Linoleate diol synthase n=1 Tax=Serpula lacrymans var. lacrymans (strain S7.3) TaxID=936435 RepID=F8Q3Q2_SERL3|nr:hypothetical protein SERLA73DRAFT_93339 [Serpula lacrymans var. lacrymans S7.3]
MAFHPPGKIHDLIQTFVIKFLYDDLPHPPATYLGDKLAFRTADGSYNNPDVPDLGKAGTPYSRSVQQANPQPRNQMPDAGLVFDTLLKRKEFVKHPAGLSSMMFSFAALVIHSVFRTDHKNPSINLTSSYVDLAPLYGNDQETQDKLRLRDGRGLLYPDVFAEDRLLLLPPAVCVILVLFSRNHNYIAKRLLEINERGKWFDPSTLTEAKRVKQEEEIFQISRLINCAWFASVVFSDYFSAILGLVRYGNSWSLSPFGEIRNNDHSLFERGRGNACSVEFNCLYRWHATTSVQDEKWIQAQFEKVFPGKKPEDITVKDFYSTEAVLEASEPDIQHWTFDDLKRQEDGSFKDSDLAKILHDATEHPAAAFGARSTPHVMRLHEVMGIEANRSWGVCSLNDFRKFLGLKTYESFLEWNPDKEIADAAEKLYGHIDNLELYVGLQAEQTKPVVEGAGLCPGYTISRAILSDAIALTRGDRFYTQDYTPFNMTAWGFADCQRDPNGFGFGSTLGRLILRTLPNDFTKNSVYTWFPLMTPDAMEPHLKKLKLLDQYDLKRPGVTPGTSAVEGYVEVGEILKDTSKFGTEYAARAKEVIKGKGFYTASENGEEEKKEFLGALAPSTEAADAIGKYFFKKTTELIKVKSFSLVGENVRGVNVVRDVLKYVPIYWAATEVAGIRIKSKESPHGAFGEQELYDMLGEIYTYVFLDVEQSKYMVLQEAAKGHVEKLLHHIKGALGGPVSNRISIAGLVGTISGMFGSKSKKDGRVDFLKRLFELGHSTDQLANSILAVMVHSVEISLGLTNIVNILLDADQTASFRSQAEDADAKEFAGLEAYVLEALRLDPPFRGVYRVAKENTTVGSLTVTKGERLFLNIADANLNDDVFPNPTTFDASRSPKEKYLRGDGAFKCLGREILSRAIVQVLLGILSFDNVRRGPGQSGKLTRFKDAAFPDLQFAYLNDQQFATAWPSSLIIQYDVPGASS